MDMIGFYNYSVILTYAGLASTIFGITQVLQGNFKIALVCLMISGMCDMFDGKVARSMERTEDEKRFGIQIDSLCDLVCFGIFPAMIGYAVGMRGPVGISIIIIYILAALIRLAFFNVMEEKRQEQTDEVRHYYRGMPVTMAALIFPFVFVIKSILDLPFLFVYAAIMLITAFLFVFDFRVKKAGTSAMIGMAIFGVIILIRLIFCAL